MLKFSVKIQKFSTDFVKNLSEPKLSHYIQQAVSF
jgi:hypothetical protein